MSGITEHVASIREIHAREGRSHNYDMAAWLLVAAHLDEIEANNIAASGISRADLNTPDPRVGELIKAGKEIVERWDSPRWKWDEHTAVFIDHLRTCLNAFGE